MTAAEQNKGAALGIGPSNVERTLTAIRDPNSSVVLVAAHRGGYKNDKLDLAPENSIENILNCQRKGYDLYETDIQRTKDGHFVIMHDPTIDRETNSHGEVRNHSLKALKQLHKRYRDGTLSTARMATLAEFLTQGDGRTIFKADLKPGVSTYFKELLTLIEEQDGFDKVIFRVPYHELPRFIQYKTDGLVWPRHSLMFRIKNRFELDHVIKEFNPSLIHIDVKRNDPANDETLDLIRDARDRGLHIQTHAEGEPEDWSKLVYAGVRMFHTSAPDQLALFCRTLNASAHR